MQQMQESEILEIRRGKSTLKGVSISFGLFGSASTAGYVQGELGHGFRGHGHHHLQQHPQIVLHACHSDNFKDNELLLRWQHMRSLSSSLPTTWSRPPQGDFLLSFLLRFLQIMQEMRPIQYAFQFSLAHPNNWWPPPASSPPSLCLRRPRSSFLTPGKGRRNGESFICVSYFFTAANSKTSVSNECSLGFPRRRAGLELRTVSLLHRWLITMFWYQGGHRAFSSFSSHKFGLSSQR